MGLMLAAAPRWESVTAPTRPASEQRIGAEGADLEVREGSIYVWATKPVTVKVFTILGQLISQESLGQGVHRLNLGAKGIYIVKIGASTRRVTI